ncbi:MAG TPA: cation-translocating P-type ATPase [Ktedonobacteraceae bacterium]|nr:cation-translocating P-type ATPase [Ktedonobacteraceae bacterium]
MTSVTTKDNIEMVVPGLCCVECSSGVVTALKEAAGVQGLQVLGTAEKVVVTYDGGVTSPHDLVGVVEQAGHRVQSWRPLSRSIAAEGGERSLPVISPPTREDTASAGSGDPCDRRTDARSVPTAAPKTRRDRSFATLRLAFVGLVAVIALVEIAGESLGLLHGVVELVPIPIALAAVVLGGYPIFRRAFFGLRARHVNTDLVMSVGILAAVAIGEFVGASLIVFFVSVAHYLEDLTTGRARRAIAELVTLVPRTARVKREQHEEEVPVEALQPGDMVVVRPGERIAVDGVVLTGHASVNQAPITGESMAVEKSQGDGVFAGTVNELGYLEVQAQRVGEETTLGRIINLVEEAEAHKAPVQRFADRFSAIFLPLVLTIAGLTLLFSHHLEASIAVLVAACPCAVGLATPLSVVAAVGAGARRGLLIKGGLYLETLAKVDTLVIDKTGTLTYGRPRLTDVVPFGETTKDDVLRFAAALEHYSEHPLATTVLGAAAERGLRSETAYNVEIHSGRGITGEVNGVPLLLGTQRLLEEDGISLIAVEIQRVMELEADGKTVLLLAHDRKLLGILAAADTLRAEVPIALRELRAAGIQRILLLTGDNAGVASAIARQAGITEVAANLLPEDKIAAVRRLQAEGHCVAMIGDGINDAPALMQADIGIAMGVAGTDVALEAADVALMRDDWTQVPEALRLGRRAYRTIRQNMLFGIVFNALVIGLAATSLIGPVIAAASQAVPDVAVALNASRLLRWPRGKRK